MNSVGNLIKFPLGRHLGILIADSPNELPGREIKPLGRMKSVESFRGTAVMRSLLVSISDADQVRFREIPGHDLQPRRKA